jgi:hypothetical protein
MLISTPYPTTGTASEAVIATGRSKMHWLGRGKSPRLLVGATTRLRLEKHRHRKPGVETALSVILSEAKDLPPRASEGPSPSSRLRMTRGSP